MKISLSVFIGVVILLVSSIVYANPMPMVAVKIGLFETSNKYQTKYPTGLGHEVYSGYGLMGSKIFQKSESSYNYVGGITEIAGKLDPELRKIKVGTIVKIKKLTGYKNMYSYHVKKTTLVKMYGLQHGIEYPLVHTDVNSRGIVRLVMGKNPIVLCGGDGEKNYSLIVVLQPAN